MRDDEITAVLRAIRARIATFDDPTSVGEVARDSDGDPFRVLIATLISLRTREEVTRAAARRLFALADTPHALAELPLEMVAQAIAPATFTEAKARTLREVARTLRDQHHGKVPATLEGLTALKGVGLKTANLVLGLAFGVPAICVDIHVHRVLNRLGYVATATPDATEAALRAKLPRRYWVDINQWLVPFGRNQCTPTAPRCSDCPVAASCARVGVARHR